MLKSLISMLTVFKHLFKKPVTLEYPEKSPVIGENFRGKPIVTACHGCGTCVRVCPASAISLRKNEFQIDLKKCIFCGNCSYYCPKGFIKMSKEYELATADKSDLKLLYRLEGNNERD